MRILKSVSLIGFIMMVVFGGLSAQQTMQTGSVAGTVTDVDGVPLPGVSVTVRSPALIGSVTDVTRDNGAFRAMALPPGTYEVTAELTGFRPVRHEGVVVRVGTSMRVDLVLEASSLEEEIFVTAAAPVVDVRSSKITSIVTSSEIARLPLGRNLNSIMSMAPGSVNTGPRHVIHGGTEISTTFDIDGINVNDPSNQQNFFRVQYDSMEEIEIATGALPAQVGSTGGTFVNVVTKSGGNEFHGTFQTYYTRSELAEILFPDTQLKAMGIGKPVSPNYDFDLSATLGGPVKKDKLWFFSSFALGRIEQNSDFIPATILGRSFDQYLIADKNMQGLLKLTTQISKSMRFFVMGNYQRSSSPHVLMGPRITQESTGQQPGTVRFAGTANLNWVLSSNSFLDLRASVSSLDDPIYNQDSVDKMPNYRDFFTGYQWGATTRAEEHTYRNIQQASARMTQFVDDFLAGNHEIQVGLEYQRGSQRWDYWRHNPMSWHYHNGSPYYYRSLYGLDGPHPTFGDGRLSFFLSSGEEDGNQARTEGVTVKLAGFIQDSWTIKNRLTLNLGLRFDHLAGSMPAQTKRAAPGLPEAIGAAVVEPAIGINPWGTLSADAFDNLVVWNTLSPRIGLTYDLFGDAKTALKASFSRYAEGMPTMYYLGAHPLRANQLNVDWWDLNNNGIPDLPGVDRYNVQSYPVYMLSDFYNNRHLDGIKAPMFNQWTIGVDHAFSIDFSVGVKFISTERVNAVDDVLYDRETGRIWNTYEKAPEWWVPFTTIVPGYGQFPDQEVTMYFMSQNAPWRNQFTAMTNVEEAERKYRALEISFNKRYSKGWALGGSAVFSKTEGNNSEIYGSVWGWSAAYNTPNWFVNGYGRTPFDIPFQAKLFGSFELPLGFVTSFFLNHSMGTTWQRTVQIFPPAAWAAANKARAVSYTVNVEPRGSQRYQSSTQVDFRLEKEFLLGAGKKLGVFMDVFNLFGARYVYSQENPGGRWFPTGENTSQGNFLPDGNYGKLTGIEGTRIIKLSVRFGF